MKASQAPLIAQRQLMHKRFVPRLAPMALQVSCHISIVASFRNWFLRAAAGASCVEVVPCISSARSEQSPSCTLVSSSPDMAALMGPPCRSSHRHRASSPWKRTAAQVACLDSCRHNRSSRCRFCSRARSVTLSVQPSTDRGVGLT